MRSEDPSLEQAIDLVTRRAAASVSFLQRHLRIGYSRAARLIDMLEARGIIGPATGTSKARDVLHEPPATRPQHSGLESGNRGRRIIAYALLREVRRD